MNPDRPGYAVCLADFVFMEDEIIKGDSASMNARYPSVPTCLLKVIFAALLEGLISSCAMTGNAQDKDIEQDLAAAGFQKMLGDTPGKLAQIQTLPQHQVVPYQKNGANYYLYADAARCKCLYEGTQEAYQRYQLARAERTRTTTGNIR